MWKKINLTTADNIKPLSFSGAGSIYAEGTFGSGVVEVHIVSREDNQGAKEVSSGFLDDAIDGTDVKSKYLPSGDYELQLTGSTGGNVTVFYNDQVEKINH